MASFPSRTGALAFLVLAALTLGGCATASALRNARAAEQRLDYDLAVVEYMKVLKANPNDRNAQASLDQVKLRAAAEHFSRGRRHAGMGKLDEALVEYQLAAELNPAGSEIQDAMRAARTQLRAKVAVGEDGRTRLETLVDQSLTAPLPGVDLPTDITLPDTLIFREASSRDVFTAIGRFADVSVVFDQSFQDVPVTIDLRKAGLEQAISSLAAATRNFWRVTAPRTLTVVPDTPSKRREYEEEIVRTFYLSNADLKETIDILRIVVDARRLAALSATNAITIKDTPERIAAAGRIIRAIDKARPEVVIDVELLEVNRTRLREYGLQIASPASTPTGIDGQATVNRDGLTLQDLRNLTQSNVFLTNLPALYYRLLKTDTATRVLANPQLRTSEGISARARFGERVPVPVTTFAPIASGGVQTQPITSFNYENIGVNIDLTPRTHHDDDVSLAVKVEVSSLSGTGFQGLPTFGNRSIDTVIRLKDGETNMLAGLIRDDERRSLNGIPGLSDLPVLGRLFGHNHRDAQETDIILTLTPRIVRVLDLSEADLQPFRVGRDAGSPIIDLPLPAPVNPPRPPLPATVTAGETTTAAPATATAAAAALDSRHLRAQAFEVLDERAVSSIDGLQRRDTALPVRRERRGDERHPRSDVAAVERLPFQPSRTVGDDAMGIAQEQVRAHPTHLFQREETQLVHPVVHQRRAVGLGREDGDEAHQIAGKRRPQPRRDPSRADQPGLFDAEHAVLLTALHVELPQHGRDDLHVDVAGTADFDGAARDRRHDGPTSGFDVVPVQRLRRAAQLHAPIDDDGVRAFARNARAHRPQELAQLDDVRFAGRVPDLAAAGSRHGRQHRRFGARDGRFIEVQRGRLQAVRRFQEMPHRGQDGRAHCGERPQVRVDRPARRKVATRRRDVRATPSRQ
jgi:general secretion pathway protein D